MYLKKAHATFVSICSLLAVTLTATAGGADVDNYLIAKGQSFSQISASTPQSIPSDNPFRATAIITPAGAASVTSASIKGPTGHTATLSYEDGRWSSEGEYSNKLTLDHNIPAGKYTLTIATADQGTVQPALLIGPDAYPSTPHVANWTDAQNVEADQPFTLTWDTFVGGTSNDTIIVQAESDDGSTTVFSTPFLLEPSALDGRATSVDIPANTLAWNTTYKARILFIKRTSVNTNAYPTVPGLTGYYKETHFTIVTPAAPAAAGRIQFSASNFLFHENDGTIGILITRSGSSGAVTVNFSTISGTAQDGIDYTDLVQHVSGGTISFADGQTTALANLILVDNSIFNSNKTFAVHLSNATGGAALGARTDAVVTIVENEQKSAGTIQFSKPTATITEAGKSVLLTVARTGGSSGTVSVDFRTSDGAAQSGSDYTGTNGTLVFGPGKIVQTITIPILNDTLSEVSEAFYVYLDNISSPGILGSTFMATVNITSDDLAGSLSLGSAKYSISEAGTNLTVKVNRSGGAASDVTIDYATQPGTAVAGFDYTDTHGTFTFAAKETTKTIVIPIINNNGPDGNRQFTIVLSNPGGGGTIGKIPVATATIVDDEPSIAFEAPFYTVKESGASVTVKLVRTGPLSTPASVTYQTVDLSATAGVDYTGSSATIQFPANVASKTITIPILKDTIVEGSENFYVWLTGATGVQLGRVTQAVVTIADDDFGGTINFSAATYSGTEGSKVTVTIKRTGGLASGVTVQFTMSGGTATSGVDYTNMTQVVTFNANEVSKIITVPLIQDVTTESSETVNLTLSNATGGGTVGTLGNAVLTINNKPDPNAVAVSGTPFMKGTVGGVAFTAISSSVIGARTGTAFTLNGTWTSGSGLSTVSHLFTAVVNPMALGPVTMDNSGNHGTLALVNGGLSGSHEYAVGNGSDTVGTYGTVTVDGLDIPNHRISGRFTFHAREDTGNVPGAFIEIVGSFRENLQ